MDRHIINLNALRGNKTRSKTTLKNEYRILALQKSTEVLRLKQENKLLKEMLKGK